MVVGIIAAMTNVWRAHSCGQTVYGYHGFVLHLPSSVMLNDSLGYKECKGGDNLWIDSVLVEAVTKSFTATVTWMLPLFWSWGFWLVYSKLQSFSVFHCYGIRSSWGLHMKFDFLASCSFKLRSECVFFCVLTFFLLQLQPITFLCADSVLFNRCQSSHHASALMTYCP